MAHQITSTDGLVLANNRRAWHGLGKLLPDTVSPMQALDLAGLNWQAVESDALTATFVNASGEAERLVVPSHKALRRSDNGQLLSCVGSGYHPLQNADLFRIAEGLSSVGGVRIESAGSLFGGRKVFVLIRGETVDVGGRGDIMHQFALLGNSHDGTMAALTALTNERVVCDNTLTAAVQDASHVRKWRHTAGFEMRVEEVSETLARWRAGAADSAAEANALAGKTLTREQVQDLWVEVLERLDGPIAANPTTEKEARRRDRAAGALAHMSQVFDAESQQFGPSAWVAANAATNWIQHVRPARLSAEAAFASDKWGAGAEAKRTAMKTALALL